MSYSGGRLVLAVRGVLFGGDETEAVAASVLLVEEVPRVFIRPHFYRLCFLFCHSQGLAQAIVWPCVLSVPYSVLVSLFFIPPHDSESWAGFSEVENAVQSVICLIANLASGHLIVLQL